MIDHIGFPVFDYQRSKAFYAKALAPLDYSLVMEVTQEQTGHDAAAGFGANGKPDFWIGGEGALDKPLHVAILAKDRSTTRLLSQRADATTARQVSVRTITPITTVPSCSILTATTSRPCATSRSDGVPILEQLGACAVIDRQPPFLVNMP
jgi:catechol 2,3-dioxygenase-like lactoylglutathione lyase family enzyme